MKQPSNPLKWHGGKYYLADRIIGLMPPHRHYVEPFFGGGAVLFRKPFEGTSEAINDINPELASFWQVLSNANLFSIFERQVQGLPFSEELWDWAKSPEHPDRLTVLDRAVAFFVRYRQSRQGLGQCFATLSRNRTRRGMNEQASAWLSAIDGLPAAHERLKRVVILNRDALDVIRSQDGPDTLFYLDPPYLHETRVTTSDYEHEMTAEQHGRLLETLGAVTGRFILSGYRSDLYDEAARAYGWVRVDVEIDNKASGKKLKERKTECLWMNY